MEERLASLEAKVEGIADLRRDMNVRFTELRNEMNGRFAEVSGRITELRGDMNGRFEGVNRRFDEVNRQSLWLMGMMVTGFITVIAALIRLTNQ